MLGDSLQNVFGHCYAVVSCAPWYRLHGRSLARSWLCGKAWAPTGSTHTSIPSSRLGGLERNSHHRHSWLATRPPQNILGWTKLQVSFQRRATDTYDSTVFPCAHCSGDLGDFASFVTHMKQIAIVRPPVWTLRSLYINLLAGKRCRPSFGRLRWSTWRYVQTIHSRQSNTSLPGTGLSDGYPPGGVDAHDVCSIRADAHLETDILHLSFTVKWVP